MPTDMKPRAKDIDIESLVPLHERPVNFHANNGFRKILASIKAVGLVEPLCVFEEDDAYVILDGFVRYRACQELGLRVVPCLVYAKKEAYTFNRMVNALSHTQQARMIQESLTSLQAETVAEVFGLRTLKHRLSESLYRRLDPCVVKALDRNQISQTCAGEFTFVKPKRQLQILEEMKRSGDYATSFARALVLRTPPSLRNREKSRRSPWDQNPAQKQELVAKLEAAEKRYDFYSSLYRQYTTDLLRLCIFVRKLVANDRAREFMQENMPEVLARFEEILFQTQGAEHKDNGSGQGADDDEGGPTDGS